MYTGILVKFQELCEDLIPTRPFVLSQRTVTVTELLPDDKYVDVEST